MNIYEYTPLQLRSNYGPSCPHMYRTVKIIQKHSKTYSTVLLVSYSWVFLLTKASNGSTDKIET